MKLIRENIMFEKFTEKSDPISDMGIGAKPKEILEQFVTDFIKEFKIEPYLDWAGGNYDLNADDVYNIEGQSGEYKHPINLLIAHPENGNYGLDFVMNNKAAIHIIDKPDAKWGFIYWAKGKAIPLKSKHLRGVVKEIMKIRKMTSKGLDGSIKKYQDYITEVKKMKSILNES